jgi:hypothetical protein
MRARKSIKLNVLIAAFIIVIFSATFYQHKQQKMAQLQRCLSSDHLLPINHINHPCQKAISPNQNWWAWLKGDSSSSYFHFLDLLELLHSKGL